MLAMVTGAAGFIGSTLTEQLLALGHTVRGIDAFTPYYDIETKRRNLSAAMLHPSFELVDADLGHTVLAPLLDGVDVVFHQAGQPGVRLSWSEDFHVYEAHNVLATQRLLEAVRGSSVQRLVFASSSSVYGEAATYPCTEEQRPQPFSPYGVTKLAAEHLCCLYAANWGVPAVALRYFTVYGPRQRPDMAMHRIIDAALTGRPFHLFGTGAQVRDFTFVDDVVHANVLAADSDLAPGTVLNIAGGTSTDMRSVIDRISRLTGIEVEVVAEAEQAGDVARTGGDRSRAEALLGWQPRIGLDQGLAAQIRWHRERR